MISKNILNVHCVLLRTLLRDTVMSPFCSPVRLCTHVWESNRLSPSLWTNAALWAKLRRLSGTHVRDVKRTHVLLRIEQDDVEDLLDILQHCNCSATGAGMQSKVLMEQMKNERTVNRIALTNTMHHGLLARKRPENALSDFFFLESLTA